MLETGSFSLKEGRLHLFQALGYGLEGSPYNPSPPIVAVSVSGVPVAVLDEKYIEASRTLMGEIELYLNLVRVCGGGEGAKT